MNRRQPSAGEHNPSTAVTNLTRGITRCGVTRYDRAGASPAGPCFHTRRDPPVGRVPGSTPDGITFRIPDDRRDYRGSPPMSTYESDTDPDGVGEWGRFHSRSKRTPDHPAIELCLKTDSEDGSAIYHPDELHDPEIAEPWILVEPDGGLVHVSNCR